MLHLIPTFLHIDADWAANINTRWSITGYVVYLGAILSLGNQRNNIPYLAALLKLSTTNVCWIHNVLRDLHVFVPSPPSLNCDNVSVLALSTNPVFHSLIKHLDTDFHFIREKVQQGDHLVHYVPTQAQVVDVLTKGLHNPVFIQHCINLNLADPG